jgi:hypothetical protein
MKGTYKFIIALAILAVVGAGGWWTWQAQSQDTLAELVKNPGTKATDEQVRELVARLGEFMVVPDTEKPSVAVLQRVTELAAQQEFYKGAKDGDILVIFSNRAIIYDALANRLVNVGPISRNEATPAPVASGSATLTPSAAPSASPTAPEKSAIDVLNGTATAGLAGSTASELKKNAWVTIGRVGDAKGAYKTTVIVDLSGGKRPGAIAALEKQFAVKAVTVLPTGEASTADILVIIGK